MRIKVLLLVLVMIFTLMVPVQANIAFTQENPLQTEETYGKYVISVKDGDDWSEVGSLSFSKFQSKKAIDIEDYLNGSNTIIKLVQNGGGSAYLDAVLLGTDTAAKANDGDVKLLNKLSKEDLDITPVGENGVILEFSSSKSGMLTVVGRIEPVVISKEPLQFPAGNNFKTKDEIKDFYSYTIGNNLGTVIADGVLNETEGKEPFVKEYRTPDSGHPAGDVYFWVMNDDKNLYVSLDFTPDNTFDGDKDYAKVYVKTNEGIKEFKVSELEKKCGTTAFTYTENVAYEHKAYEFLIPLNEINVEYGNEVSVAFVAYGTASYSDDLRAPAIAYDSVNEVYLCVFEYSRAKIIVGEFVDKHGDGIGNRFEIASLNSTSSDNSYVELSDPSLSFNPNTGKFLVTWVENRDYPNNDYVCASFVSYVNVLVDNPIIISTYTDDGISRDIYTAKVAYDSNENQFLTVWQEANEGDQYGIFGQFIDANGLKKGTKFDIRTPDTTYKENPSLAYSESQEFFLVSWQDGTNMMACGLKYSKGIRIVSNMLIVDEGGKHPNVSYNFSNEKLYISWEKEGNTYGRYYGLYYIPGANYLEPHPVGNLLNTSSPHDEYEVAYPAAYYNGYNSNMLNVWSLFQPEQEGYAELLYVDVNAKPSGTPFFTDEDPDYRDEINVYNLPIAISGDNAAQNIIAYVVNGSRNVHYRIINNVPEEPLLTITPNPINKYVGDSFNVEVKYFDGVSPTANDVTDDVIINIDNPAIATSDSAIKGTFTCTAVGETTLRTTYAGIEATAILIVTKNPAPSTGGGSPTRTPIGEISVNDKVIQTLYNEDVTTKNNTYTFTADKEGDHAKLWLNSGFYKDLAKDYPNKSLNIVWDKGTYTLPLNCDEVLDEIGSSAKTVSISIEKVKDKKIIDAANVSATFMGGNVVSDLIDFSVIVEKGTGNTEINSLDFYAIRTINKLNITNKNISTAMKFVEEKEILTFAPSVFAKDYATVKYRGNGIFTIIENPQTFADINNHWAKTNIEKLATRNIAFGKQNNQFVPNDFITRAEFAVMITRALAITEEEGSNNFKDVSDEWFAEDIKTAIKAGLINGKTDGKFYPNEKILRKDMAVIINNALKFADNEMPISDIKKALSIFTDSNLIDEYAKESIAACANAGIIIGRDNKDFDPNANATRAEASAIVERMLKYLNFMD